MKQVEYYPYFGTWDSKNQGKNWFHLENNVRKIWQVNIWLPTRL